MCSLSPEQLNDAGLRPFTDTFVTVIASDRSSVNVRNAAKVTAVIVADPESRLIATLYSRSSSYRETRYPKLPLCGRYGSMTGIFFAAFLDRVTRRFPRVPFPAVRLRASYGTCSTARWGCPANASTAEPRRRASPTTPG